MPRDLSAFITVVTLYWTLIRCCLALELFSSSDQQPVLITADSLRSSLTRRAIVGSPYNSKDLTNVSIQAAYDACEPQNFLEGV